MHLRRLWLHDVRSWSELDVELSAGVNAVLGPNGVGKTNLMEAVAYLALLESFRGAPTDALVRAGASTAVVRGEIHDAGREQLIEAEISAGGRNRVLLNRQRLTRNRDLFGALRVTVFSPDDLELIKGGPALRRRLLDQTLVALDARNDALRSEVERALRQRNALLKQTRGRLDEAAALTLEVWDSKLAAAGDALAEARAELVEQLEPIVAEAYHELSGAEGVVSLRYASTWREYGLAAALAAARDDEIRRGVTLVGPQRDDLSITLAGLASRTHASQGEQRCLALALRLGTHRLVHERSDAAPLLLLDDVFSELDPARSAALVRSLPEGQTLLSTASGLPPGVEPDLAFDVSPGELARRDRA